ncbi:MAG: alpha-amylase, partial [Lachnospiraceae bacterium]|nr:alpha-amylase [Lachnospiraceae bacterium]
MRRRMEALLLAGCLLLGSFMAGCAQDSGSKEGTEQPTEGALTPTEEASAMFEANAGELQIIDDKYRTYYEVFVYSFADSDGDGVGDLRGLIDNLDYINDGDDATDTDLGCNGIWLMPIMPSTTYHKYDVTDYEAIDPEYGTMED